MRALWLLASMATSGFAVGSPSSHTSSTRASQSTSAPTSHRPVAHYKTEPYLQPAWFNITQRTDNLSLLAPGYFFLSLQVFAPKPKSWGPQIFNNDGELVFMNPPNSSVGPQEPHVCDYLGQKGSHLCVSNIIEVTRGIWSTKKAVFKSDYTLAQEPYGAVGDFPAPDGHEFQMVDNGYNYLQPIFNKVHMDLRPFGGEEDGIILDGCFQEVQVETGDELFKWCYMDHFEISNTYIYLNVDGNKVNQTSHMAGFGNEDRPWDAFHINSMDKNWEGDYLISIRHSNHIIKIAGRNNKKGFEPGHVLWKIEGLGGHNGKLSDYKLDGFNFSRQHHVRYVDTTLASTTLSLFNNAYEGDNDPSSEYSAGMIIKLDHPNKRASLVKEYRHPESLLSLAAGSLQALPNRNQLVGWGWKPYVTEYDYDGNVLFDADFADSDGKAFSYRTKKYAWTSRPGWDPKVVAYSQTCSLKKSPLMAYASWNGATEVSSWRFFVSLTDRKGPWFPVGTFPKKGFETEVKLLQNEYFKHLPFIRWVSTEALDADKKVLGGTVSKTFVPIEENRTRICSKKGCTHGFAYPEKNSVAGKCSTSPIIYLIPGFLSLVVVFFAIESFDTLGARLLDRWSALTADQAYMMTEKTNS